MLTLAVPTPPGLLVPRDLDCSSWPPTLWRPRGEPFMADSESITRSSPAGNPRLASRTEIGPHPTCAKVRPAECSSPNSPGYSATVESRANARLLRIPPPRAWQKRPLYRRVLGGPSGAARARVDRDGLPPTSRPPRKKPRRRPCPAPNTATQVWRYPGQYPSPPHR